MAHPPTLGAAVVATGVSGTGDGSGGYKKFLCPAERGSIAICQRRGSIRRRRSLCG
ncbi:MAG: hypothetical protein WCL32_08045 [Planctomycetota bacterium]